MARNSKKKLAIFAGTSKCLIYVSVLDLNEADNAPFSLDIFYKIFKKFIHHFYKNY